jgi:hypothetical protein
MSQDQIRLDVGLAAIFDALTSDLHTCMPGRVIEFDADEQTISVQPCLKRKYLGEDDPVNLPVIEDVPVVFPGSEDLWLIFDVKVDSYVLLVFAERAIAAWHDSGGIIDPEMARKFDLSDAIAIPGILPTPVMLDAAIDSDTIAMRNSANTTRVSVEEDGTITATNAVASVVLETGGDVVINGGTGTAVEYAGLKIAFDQLKSDFDALVVLLNAHIHTDPISGVTSPPTAPPWPLPPGVLPSSADMSPSESETIKIPS